MKRGSEISSSMIREVILLNTLERLEENLLLDDLTLDDTYHSLMFTGPPGVGKSVLQLLAAKDVAGVLSDIMKKEISVSKISIRISNEDAVALARRVIDGTTIPYVHLYLPQTKIWNLEGTPSPMDSYVDVGGVKLPVNVWRMDAYMIPLLDYRDIVKDRSKLLPAFLVLDEFNMAEQDVLRKLFQLARSAELGRAKLNPLTTITLVGNTPETNIAAMRYIADPLIDRAEVYVVSKPDVSGWLAYMEERYGEKWAKSIGAYLTINPKEIYVQGKSGPSGGTGEIQTPRDFTIFSVRLYMLKRLLAKKLIDSDKFWRRVDNLARSLFIEDTANSIIGFLRGLQAVNIQEVIKNPEQIASLDKNVAAYALIMATSGLVNKYKASRSDDEKEKILSILAELSKHGVKVLGPEAVSIVLSSMPMPMRIAMEKKLPPEILRLASETRKMVKEIEDALVA